MKKISIKKRHIELRINAVISSSADYNFVTFTA